MGQNSGLLSSLTDWNSTLAGYADSISTGVVMPVALTLLALFMILELYNATQRIAMNGSNNAFAIQQIALVMLKIVVCRWAVVHTTEILNALFEVASTVTVGISGYVGSGEVNTTVDIENAIAALPGGIGNMPVALELMVVGWMLRIVNIVVNTIVAARFIELYAVRMNLPAYMGVRYELTNQIEDAEELLDNLHNYNQKIFKVCILIHTYGRNNAELDERVQQICNTVQQQTCRFSAIPFEQCAAMNSVLPLGKKWLALERTLLTVNTAIYVPFTTQELFQPGGLYEGTNARSKNLIMVNRKLLPAPAGMVLGMTGFGKSFAVMQMMAGIMLRWPEDDLVIIDPENEYARLVEAFGGEVIEISASSKSHINPMDISEDYGDEGNPIQLKSQFLRDFCQLVLNSKELSAQECSLVDRAALITYQKYLLHPEREQMPSLHDFYNNLSLQGPQAKALTMALSMYVDGTMDLFAHQTNVDLQNHCICFNTVKLGKSMQSIGMMTVLDQIWNRITRNRVLGRRTWIFTDEFQLLLGNSACTNYYFELSSRARKWGAILTSITQHVRSVLNNEDARRMLSDCGYIKLLNQAPDDANDIARLLHISDEEKRYIENAEVGSGLLIADKVVVPFNNTFPQDTELFRLMDTNPNRKK